MVPRAWRLAGSVVERETWRRRDLSFVKWSSKDEIASSCGARQCVGSGRVVICEDQNHTLLEKTTKANPLLLPPRSRGIRTLSTSPYFAKTSFSSSSVTLQSTFDICTSRPS